MVSGMDRPEQPGWIPMAEIAVKVIYALAEHPDAICGGIFKKLLNFINTASRTVTASQKGVLLWHYTVVIPYNP